MDRISTDQQRRLIEELGKLIAERAQSEASIQSSFAARESTTKTHFNAERERLNASFQREKSTVQSQHNSALAMIARSYENGVEAAIAAHDQRFREISQQAEGGIKSAQDECELRKQRSQNAYEESVRDTKEALTEFKANLQRHREELEQLNQFVDKEILRKRSCLRLARQLPEKRGVCDSAQPIMNYATEFAAASETRQGFRRQWAPKLLIWEYMIALYLLSHIILYPIAYFNFTDQIFESNPWLLVVAAGVIALGITAIVWVIIRQPAVRQTLELYSQFQQQVANAGMSLDAARVLAVAEADQKRVLRRGELDREVQDAERDRDSRIVTRQAERAAQLAEAAETLQEVRKAVVENRDVKLRETNAQFGQQLKALHASFDQRMRGFEARFEQELAASRETFERAWRRLIERWTGGLSDFQTALDSMNEYCESRFPDWNATDWAKHDPIDASLPALRFGKYGLGLGMFEGGVPSHEDLRPAESDYTLPAVLSFADHPTLLFEAFGDGRLMANQAIQNVMLRLLTSLPPGKVRFTIVDPVGLGQNFSAFMHLADYDEKLVTHRIWTESSHITQRLTDLTEHMEDVIQTYLRNEFKTIDEYNADAGEVAEPFHILVVANFPAGFSEEAAQRLLSIVTSGSKCGVYTLLSTDSKIELPRNFHLADLEANAAAVQWDGSRFHWIEEDIKDLPLTLDEPPSDEHFTEIIKTVGQRAKEAIRVEVPFSMVAPADDQWWTHDSRGGIEIPLGRAGATKLQHLRLGKGTSQHVLISGKTGSGKSTLLHAMIANTALHYGPDEVQFYLIDFKKGVEFKPYATYALPHARVIAIESEREFGMSVLERLDLELRTRGDLFRDHGVADIKSFRDANPATPLPRIMLIIDEFQEFFVQDDKVSQDAALLLDRLVRQGRAFGIHVLLGSQTLAGAYSLARSTLGQMAVRIALQCSEADSHLILSEDNTAARLLNRPGEAIYNDANGLFEGNHPFQVVWLGAQQQEAYLRQLRENANSNGRQLAPPIVFEGNAPADPRENGPLRTALTRDKEAPTAAPTAWLGSAVAIKDPTSVTFRRQSGSNLLLVGQQEEAFLGIMGNALVSLAATARPATEPESTNFYVFDGARPDSVEAGFWPRVVADLSVGVRLVDTKGIGGAMTAIAAELQRRLDSGDETAPSIFLFIHNLSRLRDLRRADDEFSFSSMDDDKPPTPGKQFVEILREGPAVGIHALVWCDTFNNVNRWFDRQTLRDLDYRVLCQMSATDSSNLMDSPAASRLGTHRALLYSEEQGEFEKFRPYAPPSDEWLAWVHKQIAARHVPAS
ncbi:MAG: FtsK/SpoIIIE domain-containing protein [Planctomycetota bacterium]|nr:FtsK/SpoIIIE domain-containing protein [Planctomycetota bacterium]